MQKALAQEIWGLSAVGEADFQFHNCKAHVICLGDVGSLSVRGVPPWLYDEVVDVLLVQLPASNNRFPHSVKRCFSTCHFARLRCRTRNFLPMMLQLFFPVSDIFWQVAQKKLKITAHN